MTNPMDLAKTLEGLSAAATQGEWEVHDYCKPSERRMIWDSPLANTMCIEAVKPDDAAFITTLVTAFRTGQLIVAQAGDVEAVARAIAVCADKLNEEAPDTCGRLTFVINRSDQFAQAAISAMPSLAAKDAEIARLREALDAIRASATGVTFNLADLALASAKPMKEAP